jgi:PST family polysaccharide transporter
MKRTVSTAFVYLVERALAVGGNFLVTLVVAREYGPDAYGAFSLAQTVAFYVAAAFLMGSEAVVVRELIHNPDRRNEVLLAAIGVIGKLTWAGAAVAAIAYIVFAPPELRTQGLVFLLVLLPTPLLAYEMDFKARRAAQVILVVRGGTTAVMAAVKVTVALQGGPLQFVGYVFAAEATLLAAFYWASYRHVHGRLPGRGTAGQVASLERTIWREVLPAALASATVVLFFRLNHLLLGSIAGLSEVGQYALAISFVQLFDTVIGVTAVAIYPRLVEMKARGEEAFLDALRPLARLYAFASLAFVVGASAVGPWLIEKFFGSTYSQAGKLLALLAWSTLFTSSALVRSQYINAYAMPRLHVKNAVAGLAAMAMVSVPGIFFWGSTGAALGLLVGCLVSGLVMSHVIGNTRRLGRIQLEGFLVWRGVERS